MYKTTFALVVAVLAIQNCLAAPSNYTAGSGFVTPCGGTINSTNCAFCEAATSTYCTACKPGYMLASIGATGTSGVSLCQQACDSKCLFCVGTNTAAGTNVANTTQANADIQKTYCQADNQQIAGTSATAWADAICRNSTNTTTIQYNIAGTPVTGTADTSVTPNRPVGSYYCYNCPANCINCRGATAPTKQADVVGCTQCADGYYLDSNKTDGLASATIPQGTCTTCATLQTINGTSSNSVFAVLASCNKCYNKTYCANATCTRVVGSTSGGSIDTTSYKWDTTKQACVSGNRLAVAFVGVVAVVLATIF